MNVKLTIYNDDKQYFSQGISLPCVIGRAKQCGVSILHPLISRQHCEIYEEKGNVYVRDLGSLNGTVYLGIRIGRGVKIPFGESFSIGRLNFKIEQLDEEVEPIVVQNQRESETSEALLDSPYQTSSEVRQGDADRLVEQVLDKVDPQVEDDDDKVNFFEDDDDDVVQLDKKDTLANNELELDSLDDLLKD